ncbi:MAG: mechanosensitive ion channel family protein [Holophagaceae bacterium]
MTDILARSYFGNTLFSWLVALGLALIALGALILLQRIVLRQLARLAQSTETDLDDLVLEVLKSTRRLTLVILALYAGSRVLSLHPDLTNFGHSVMVLTIMLQAAWWSIAAFTFVFQNMVRKRMGGDGAGETTLGLLDFVTKLAIWSIFLLLALENLGVNVTGLVTGLGIGGIAVALALQNILGDLFASLSIVLDKPFVIGDFLVVQDFLGTVEYIGLKTTRLRSLSGEQIIFPNGELLKSRIRNFKRMTERRVAFNLGVTYQTSHERLKETAKLLQQIVEAQPSVRFDRAHFKEFGDSALVFEIVYYILDPDYNFYMDTQQAINLEVFRQFEAKGLAFAYPTRTLILEHGFRPSPIADDLKTGS